MKGPRETNVPHGGYSFLGTKGLGYEKSVIRHFSTSVWALQHYSRMPLSVDSFLIVEQNDFTDESLTILNNIINNKYI